MMGEWVLPGEGRLHKESNAQEQKLGVQLWLGMTRDDLEKYRVPQK